MSSVTRGRLGWRPLALVSDFCRPAVFRVFVDRLENACCRGEPQLALRFWPNVTRFRKLSQQALNEWMQPRRHPVIAAAMALGNAHHAWSMGELIDAALAQMSPGLGRRHKKPRLTVIDDGVSLFFSGYKKKAARIRAA